MTSKEYHLKITLEEFQDRIQRLSDKYSNDDEWWISIQPHLQLDKIKVEGEKLTVERTLEFKDFDSPFHGVQGVVKSRLIETESGLSITSNFDDNRGLVKALGYFIGIGVALVFLSLMIVDFSYSYLALFIFLEIFAFVIIRYASKYSNSGIIDYHDRVIDYIVNTRL